MSNMYAKKHDRPYYAVIFTSKRTDDDDDGYQAMAEQMIKLAETMPGYLGLESSRDLDGNGVTVSYWQSLEAVRHWGQNEKHLTAQRLGREKWYQQYQVKIVKIEKTYGFVAA